MIRPEEARALVANAIRDGKILEPVKPSRPRKSAREYMDTLKRKRRQLIAEGYCYQHIKRKIPAETGKQMCADCNRRHVEANQRFKRRLIAKIMESQKAPDSQNVGKTFSVNASNLH